MTTKTEDKLCLKNGHSKTWLSSFGMFSVLILGLYQKDLSNYTIKIASLDWKIQMWYIQRIPNGSSKKTYMIQSLLKGNNLLAWIPKNWYIFYSAPPTLNVVYYNFPRLFYAQTFLLSKHMLILQITMIAFFNITIYITEITVTTI
jgi:hypothetical protein